MFLAKTLAKNLTLNLVQDRRKNLAQDFSSIFNDLGKDLGHDSCISYALFQGSLAMILIFLNMVLVFQSFTKEQKYFKEQNYCQVHMYMYLASTVWQLD